MVHTQITGGPPEQGFWHWLTDGLNQRFYCFVCGAGYNHRHIKLGQPMLYPYSDKKLCSCPPSVDFFASDMPTRKNQH